MPAKPILLVVATAVVAALLLTSLVAGHPPQSPKDWYGPISPGVAAAGLLLLAFDRWIWRWRGVQRLHSRPVLHGTWRGSLASNWVDPDTGQRPALDPDVFMVVRQRFWSVSARLLTRESASRSHVAQFERAPDGECQLVYVYSNVPRASVRGRSEIHYGGVVLNVPQSRNGRLEGHYFTDRLTTGEVAFNEHFSTVVQTHDEALRLPNQ